MTGPTSVRLDVPDTVERDDLAVFVARAVRLDPAGVVRMRSVTGGRVEAWATTPFDALATRAVRGVLAPGDVTVVGSDLLAALAVVGGPSVEPGVAVDDRWRGPVPSSGPGGSGWWTLDEVPAEALDALAEKGVAAARAGDPTGRPSAALLDQVVLTVDGTGPSGDADVVRVPMRCLFALAGMGFLGEAGPPVQVSTDGGWLRLDARGGAVVRRRRAQLPLLI